MACIYMLCYISNAFLEKGKMLHINLQIWLLEDNAMRIVNLKLNTT